MDNNFLVSKKSIMYKIISLGCGVYLNDWDEFVVSALVCHKCHRPWDNSRTECFFCGTNNFHVYKCTICNKFYSLTKSNKTCDTCGTKTLVKVCLNSECVTNNVGIVSDYIYSKGGVFQKSSSASMLNQMRCEYCGCKSSEYITKRLSITKYFDKNCNDDDVVYMKRNEKSGFDILYNGKETHHKTIEEIVHDIISVNCELD